MLFPHTSLYMTRQHDVFFFSFHVISCWFSSLYTFRPMGTMINICVNKVEEVIMTHTFTEQK